MRSQTAHAAALWLRSARGRIVEIAVDVNDVEVLGLPGFESGDGADDDAAVATDEQRNLARLLEDRRDAIANTFPGNARSRPTADGRNGMVREVTGDGDVTIVGDFATGSLETRGKFGVAIRLRVILISGVERTAAERDTEQVIGAVGRSGKIYAVACYIVALLRLRPRK